MSTLAARPRTLGIIVLGDERLPEETLAAAAACDEVFVVSRAIGRDRWLVDEQRTYGEAEQRLAALRRDLEARGVTVRGVVGDEDAGAARKDARALCSRGVFLN